MRLIAIDGLAWAGREEMAKFLSYLLGWRLCWPEDVAALFEEIDVHPDLVTRRLERPYGLMERLADVFGRSVHYMGIASAGWPDMGPVGMPGHSQAYNLETPPEEVGFSLRRLRRLLPRVLQGVAATGPVMITGCGAQVVFSGDPQALCVFVTAPKDVRARRASLALGVDEKQALRQMERVDRARRAFCRQLFREEWEDPTLYHLVLNTDTLSYKEAVNVVTGVVRRRLASAAEGEEAEAVA